MQKKIDNDKILELVNQYQKGKVDFSVIGDYLANYTYNFPRIIFQKDKDICSEFFLYIYERLPEILKKFTATNIKFTTWYVIVLRNSYFNWYKTNNNQFVELPCENEKLHYVIYKEFHDEDMDSFLQVDDKILKNLDKIINNLPIKVRIVIKLHYFDLFNEDDLKLSGEIFKIPINELFKEFNYLLMRVQKKQTEIKKLEDKVKEISSKLEFSENNSKTEQMLYNRYKKNINMLRKKYNSLDNQSIGKFLGISTNMVANHIFRGRQIIKQKIKEIL